MRYLATLFIISGLIFTTTLLAIVAAENIEPIDLDNSIFYEYSRQQANETEPQPVNLYFKGGDGGELKAEMPEGNATTEVPCVGSNTPRVLGTGVGTWTSSEIRSPITADARVTCSVWAKSEMSASNVYFHLWIRINGDNVADIWTNEQSLSTTPSEFTGEDSAGSEIQLNTGDTIEIEVIYFADPQYFIGPAPDSTMLVGGAEYDTHITITTSPITINVDEPVIENNFVIFSASYNDALSSSRLNARLMVLGDVDVITLSDPTFALGDNGSIVSWIWDHKTDKANDGEYKITVFLSYNEENEFRAIGTYMLKFPKSEEDPGLLGGLGWLMPVIIIVIIIVVIVVVVKIILGRRSAKTSKT